MKKHLIFIAVLGSMPAAATELSVGYATGADTSGFNIQLANTTLVGSFEYTTLSGVDYEEDYTSITIGYKVKVFDGLYAYPKVGGTAMTFNDGKGGTYSDTGIVYGAGVRYTTESSIILDYSFTLSEFSDTHTVSLGYAF